MSDVENAAFMKSLVTKAQDKRVKKGFQPFMYTAIAFMLPKPTDLKVHREDYASVMYHAANSAVCKAIKGYLQTFCT